MKKVLLLLACLTSGVATAQQAPPGFDPSKMMEAMRDPAKMAAMMEQAQKAQACMAGIDRAELDALEKRGRAMQEEVARLCDAGKNEAAKEKALAFGLEMSSDPTVREIQECSKGMTELMADMPWSDIQEYAMQEAEKGDICSE